MPELSMHTPAELVDLLRQTYAADQGQSEIVVPQAIRTKLARLLDTDLEFKAAVVAVLQTWLTGEDPLESDDL
ncbi:hypothetical protein [Deinococcus ruber]|uniref:Uncharacterized protein n=1 Tax=Deinococcus ruber TaxID=1848197 RepID=A0A918CKJ8_9DEIO|nr:hypothetical protein [Deinococcus ruber]GGR26283.1 hypothetical protein GCM10008957_42290 [Deinococcus ruber]